MTAPEEIKKERLEELARYSLKKKTADCWFHSPDRASVSFQMSEVVKMASRLLYLEERVKELEVERYHRDLALRAFVDDWLKRGFSIIELCQAVDLRARKEVLEKLRESIFIAEGMSGGELLTSEDIDVLIDQELAKLNEAVEKKGAGE